MPAEFRDAVAWKIQQDHATDAKSQPVEGMPFLRVDEYLLDRLSTAVKNDNSDTSRRIQDLIDRCHALAVDSAQVEIARLSGPALEEIWRACFRSEPLPGDPREVIRERYIKLLDDEYQSFTRNQKSPTDDMRRQAALILDRAKPSIRTHRGSGPFLEWVRASHPERPDTRRSPNARWVLYESGGIAKDPVKSAFDDAASRSLLEQFAPRIAQEQPAHAAYPPNCDRIGSVRLGGRPDRVEVSIQTDDPGIYAYTRKAVVRDHEHIQFVYCYWFPEHPPTKRGDPEAGPIDGATVRITLDSNSRPAIIEAVQNCGCHYRCFAARSLDESARQEFALPADQTLSALTRSPSEGIVIIADDLFDLPEGALRGPIVFSPAAVHLPVGISFSDGDLSEQRIKDKKRYELHAYELLENMPTDFGRASMFGADGLVHHAGRPEGWLLAGTGMLSAGQPRQRGTQLICWDKKSFDDPHLLEKSLRLPSTF